MMMRKMKYPLFATTSFGAPLSPTLTKVKHYSVQRVIGDGRCMFRALVKGMGINLKYFTSYFYNMTFGAMRARGAKVTDIAVILVAADDGIRPQTNEAIAHAKAVGVPIVIAINKIDKDGANPGRVMQELSSIGLVPEDWGGDIPMISALRGTNVDDLLEIIMLVAELEELKANPNKNGKGTVIEAYLQKSRGPVATFIVQNGTLKKGDIVDSREAYGKVCELNFLVLDIFILKNSRFVCHPSLHCTSNMSFCCQRSSSYEILCNDQTIIECLKLSCTGELPPNDTSGHSFIMTLSSRRNRDKEPN